MHRHLKKDWEFYLWLGQLAFTLVGVILIIFSLTTHTSRPTIWYYLGINILLLFIGSINIIFAVPPPRYIISMTLSMINTVALPLLFLSSGLRLEVVIGISLIHVILCIAITPRIVGAGVLVSVIFFSCTIYTNNKIFDDIFPLQYQYVKPTKKKLSPVEKDKLSKSIKIAEETPDKKTIKTFYVNDVMTMYDVSKKIYGDKKYAKLLMKANPNATKDPNEELEIGLYLLVPKKFDTPYALYLRIIAVYLAGALVAYIWRLLVFRMYELYMNIKGVDSAVSDKELNTVQRKLKALKAEYKLLKENLALHILEMRAIAPPKEEEEPESPQEDATKK